MYHYHLTQTLPTDGATAPTLNHDVPPRWQHKTVVMLTAIEICISNLLHQWNVRDVRLSVRPSRRQSMTWWLDRTVTVGRRRLLIIIDPPGAAMT